MCSIAQSCPTLCDPNGLQPTRLLCHRNSPGKNTKVVCHSFLQGIFPTKGSNPCLLLVLVSICLKTNDVDHFFKVLFSICMTFMKCLFQSFVYLLSYFLLSLRFFINCRQSPLLDVWIKSLSDAIYDLQILYPSLCLVFSFSLQYLSKIGNFKFFVICHLKKLIVLLVSNQRNLCIT